MRKRKHKQKRKRKSKKNKKPKAQVAMSLGKRRPSNDLYVDTQTHSWYSDGTESPRVMFEKAKLAGLAGLVITDHNLIDNVPEAIEAAEDLGLVTTPGLELYTEFKHQGQVHDIHILGYRFHLTQELLDVMAVQRETHMARARKILKLHEQHGYPITMREVRSMSHGYVCRYDISRAVAKKYHIPLEKADQFSRRKKYGGTGGFAVVPLAMPKYEMARAIDAIQGADGKACLAHLGEYDQEVQAPVLEAALEHGIDAVEVYSPKNPPETKQLIGRTLRRMDLVDSVHRLGGSDYHGARKKIKMGDGKMHYLDFKRFLMS